MPLSFITNRKRILPSFASAIPDFCRIDQGGHGKEGRSNPGTKSSFAPKLYQCKFPYASLNTGKVCSISGNNARNSKLEKEKMNLPCFLGD